MLQAEMDRMGRETLDPEGLRRLFAALGNDPALIAETLARGRLARAIVRARYESDAALRDAERPRDLLADPRARRRVVLYAPADRPAADAPGRIPLDPESLAARRDALPREGWSGVIEDADGWRMERRLRDEDGGVAVEIVSVSRRPFEDWWRETAPAFAGDAPEEAAAPADYRLPVIATGLPSAGCDRWLDAVWINKVPAGRQFAVSVWTGSEMIVWGGANAQGALNTGGRYNPAIDDWTPTSVGAGVPLGRVYHTAIWTGSEMIVWGGADSGGGYGNTGNTGGRYDPATDSWTATSTGANVPAYRGYHTAVWTGSLMIVWGGYNGGVPFNTGGRYNPSTDSWLPTSTGANCPSARFYMAALWTGSRMLVWAGMDGTYSAVNTGGRYDPVTDTWQTISTGAGAPGPRHSPGVVWTGTRMITWGSSNRGTDGGRYDPVADAWTATSTVGVPPGRQSPVNVWTGTEMIVWGGFDGASYANTGGRYNPATDTWQATATTGAPVGRTVHTGVWTGSEMIVWGGYDGASYPAAGGRYSPLTDGWLPTSTGNGVPSARDLHSGLWTGAEMIVWGGVNGSYLNSGGRFNTTLAAWSPTSTGAGVPEGRSGHSAVWTGQEMLIWGGAGAGGALDTGGRYDPAADAWQPLPVTASTPAARYLHATAWTGTELFVWGGTPGGSTLYGSGGRFDPFTSTWTPTSSGAFTPTSRAGATAVWNGSAVIVWGGSGGGYPTAGAMYAPSADLWVPMATANAPTGRTDQTAVWTGSEMIVWGGTVTTCAPSCTTSYLATGGRYNPSTDGWAAVNPSGAPSGRRLHGAAWTGSRMAVWGGHSYACTIGCSTVFFGNGAIYDPVGDAWAALANDFNTPGARYAHAAVWTGERLVVWGGATSAGNSANGGIYDFKSPATPGGSLRLSRTSTLNLAWNAAGGATSYRVRRCSGTCAPANVVASPSSPGYSETLDANGYFYAVEAVNACGATPLCFTRRRFTRSRGARLTAADRPSLPSPGARRE